MPSLKFGVVRAGASLRDEDVTFGSHMGPALRVKTLRVGREMIPLSRACGRTLCILDLVEAVLIAESKCMGGDIDSTNLKLF